MLPQMPEAQQNAEIVKRFRGFLPVVVDVETGGLNPQTDALLEIAAVVIEINQGGDMVRHTLQTVRPNLPIIEVRATRGKHVRAEPIAALYSLGRISHVGTFPELEDQMCLMTAAGFEGEGSPDPRPFSPGHRLTVGRPQAF